MFKRNTDQGRSLLKKTNCTKHFKPIPPLTRRQIHRLYNCVKVNDNGCWEWSKYRDIDGYGKMAVAGDVFSTHRLSWMASYGKVPRGRCVLHKCDNTSCINPAHLFLGSQQDNIQDCIRKMRRAYVKGEFNGRAVLTEKRVRLLRKVCKEFALPKTFLAEISGVTPTNISRVLRRKSWRHV